MLEWKHLEIRDRWVVDRSVAPTDLLSLCSTKQTTERVGRAHSPVRGARVQFAARHARGKTWWQRSSSSL